MEIDRILARKCLRQLTKEMKKAEHYFDLEEAYEAIIYGICKEDLEKLEYDEENNIDHVGRTVSKLANLMNQELITALENHLAMEIKHTIFSDPDKKS